MTAAAYARLLSPGRIGTLELRNRICLSPMGTNLEAADGTPGERITRFYEARARGGAGLIIVGVTGVAWPAGVSNPNNMGLSRDDLIPAFRALTDRVHAQGAAIAVQLQHAGRTALQDVLAARPLWVPSRTPDSAGDLFEGLSPEEVGQVTAPYREPGAKLGYHEMTAEDVATLAGWFADAAARARSAGFDAVEIHAGHGYVISSFLSPSTNRRNDAYGGPLENRARVLLEVIRAVRDRVGEDFPVWCRLDGVEYRKQTGIGEEDARQTAELAAAAGLDAIHVSAYADPRSAIGFTDAPLPHQPGAYLGLAAGIKQRIDVPVIAVGRIDPERGEQALRDGEADFVAMGRRLIADPELPNKLASSAGRGTRPCIYSYRCVGNVFLRQHATCVVNPKVGREDEPEPSRASRSYDVLVAGGGPGGLEAARRAAALGHRVTLCERESRLGGLGRAAAVAEPENAALVEWLLGEIEASPVEVRLSCPATPDLVKALDPDVVVVAVGARSERPEVPGVHAAHVFDLWSLGDGLEPVLARGPRTVIIGGDGVAAELAERLAAAGSRVGIVAADPILATSMSPPRRWRALHALDEAEVPRALGARLLEIESDAIRFLNPAGDAVRWAADAVVVADCRRPDDALARSLEGGRADLHRVGDCRAPGSFEGAFLDAARLAGTL